MQTKKLSALESATNVVVGVSVSFAFNMLALPLFGITATAWQSVQITIAFSIISFIRGYVIRRIFNGKAG